MQMFLYQKLLPTPGKLGSNVFVPIPRVGSHKVSNVADTTGNCCTYNRKMAIHRDLNVHIAVHIWWISFM
jgi:hypothetical protein